MPTARVSPARAGHFHKRTRVAICILGLAACGFARGGEDVSPPSPDQSWAPPGLSDYESELDRMRREGNPSAGQVKIDPEKVQGFAPATDFTTIRDRLVGIVLGVVVSSTIFLHLWPEREAETSHSA